MYTKDFAYFLTVTNIDHNDALLLMQQMKQRENFRGALTPDYHADDIKENRIYFECGTFGSTLEVNRDQVEETMHKLAMTFPKARFHLLAENVDNDAEQYQICTFGNMYQFSQLHSYMPALSQPVPFDERNSVIQNLPGQDFLSDFLTGTDFDLLYQQKLALLNALDKNTPVSSEVLDGLVNFLDFIGDWAEHEGVFIYPDLELEAEIVTPAPEKESLDNQISSAEKKAGTIPAGENRNIDKEIT